MGKFDKDRYLKELSVRYALARGELPWLEVIVPSSADLADKPEDLTDIDVMGATILEDGGLVRTLYDCKSNNRMSAINRAFWAAGLMRYVGANSAYVLLKNIPVHNHRMTALDVGVDLHYESSFRELGRTIQIDFDKDAFHQGDLVNWDSLAKCYEKYNSFRHLWIVNHSQVPLTLHPNNMFRKLVGELKEIKGEFDPGKLEHQVIFRDTLASGMFIWASMARDLRKFIEPGSSKQNFEGTLRYYIWGGRESYLIRKRMREKLSNSEGDVSFDMPSWGKLVNLAGQVVTTPGSVFVASKVLREHNMSALAANKKPSSEKYIIDQISTAGKIRQYIYGLSDYLVSACGIPKEFDQQLRNELNKF